LPYEFQKQFSGKGCVLTDEIHLWGAETFQKTTMTYFGQCERKYGMTATLFRSDSKEILYHAVMGECIANYSYSDAIKSGWIVPATIRFQRLERAIQLTRWEVKNWHGKAGRRGGKQKAIVYNTERNNKIVQNTNELMKEGRATIVFVDTEEHADVLERHHGLDLPLVWSGNKLRYELLKEFTEGGIDGIIGTTMIDIGVDIPRASGAVMCSGGKSPVRYYQRIGRLLRPYPTAETNIKENAIVYDFIDNGCSVVEDHALLRARILADEPAFTVQTDSDLFAMRVGRLHKIRR
jgi:superfamily II DNA or RNA helicase